MERLQLRLYGIPVGAAVTLDLMSGRVELWAHHHSGWFRVRDVDPIEAGDGVTFVKSSLEEILTLSTDGSFDLSSRAHVITKQPR